MKLESRYKICIKCCDDSITSQIVYFGNESEIIKVFGYLEQDLKINNEVSIDNESIINALANGGYVEKKSEENNKSNYLDEKEKLASKAREYADIYFPGWQDINAYWEDGDIPRVRKI